MTRPIGARLGRCSRAMSLTIHVGEVQESLLAAGFVPRTHLIWAKSRMVIGRGDYHWQHEPCWYAGRKGQPGHWQGDRTHALGSESGPSLRPEGMGETRRFRPFAAGKSANTSPLSRGRA